jgi:nucleotide-binding universal stress UspA family protein
MSILVATDFAPCSKTAVALAAALARRMREPLMLFHAVEPPSIEVPGMPTGAAWESDLVRAAEVAIAREASDFRQQGIATESRVVMGTPAHAILEVAGELRANMIVVGSHGRKRAGQLFLGSVAESVVRGSSCPVLVARDTEADLDRWETGAALRFAVAADGSPASRAALSWLGRATALHPIEPLVVRLYWPPDEAARYGLDDPWGGPRRDPALIPLLERDLKRDVQARLGQTPAQLRFRAAGREAPESLADEAALAGADAVVVGIPRGRLGRWPLLPPGRVLRASALSVLCVPEAKPAARKHMSEVRSVLVATDLSDTANQIVPAAYSLLAAGGGRVELATVHAVGLSDAIAEMPLEPPLSPGQRAEVESRLRALIPPEAEGFGITTNVSVIEGRYAAESVLAAAERLAVDVIAVGSHGRSGVKRALLGSVAEEIARTSTRPVLILRAS